MKFDMGSQTLSALARQTQGASDDLGSLIQQLIVATEPLQGNFNGAGRAAFDRPTASRGGVRLNLRHLRGPSRD